ncbi:MAG: metallophosphoesterase family protein [Candidatus Brocadiales bacterium]
MLYAILGDIHSNFEALEVVLGEIKEAGADCILSVGDIVGYGADPNLCIQTIRGVASAVVAGNHDYGAVNKTEVEYFNTEAREAVLWTSRQLSQEGNLYLSSLPLVTEKDNITLVHGSLHFPELFAYIRTFYDAELCFRGLKNGVCFVGHSHVPVAIVRDDTIRAIGDPEVSLQKVSKAIINVGSVGQPRDRNPKACYVLYDTEKNLVRFRRAAYDVVTASAKIIKAGLPAFNAERIRRGI